MIKKLLSQTFYSLFFLILLMINGVDAMAAAADNENITIASGTTCASTPICGSSDSSAANSWFVATTNAHCTTDPFVRITGPNNIVRSFKKCNPDGTPKTLATLYGICIFYCEQIKSLAKGDVADEKYDIEQTTFSKSMCNALRVVTGSAGKTFAAFAIIATGIGFFTGKVSWGLMIGVTAGIATMFGAPSIVAAISGQDVKTNCAMT